MNIWWQRWKYLFACAGVILVVFIAISIIDVFIAIVNLRFYSNAAFITAFGVGGVFAGVGGYMQSITIAPVKNETTRWSVIILIIAFGTLFWFFLSAIEGGEYEVPFKAFGLTMALTTLLFMKGKIT